MNYPNAVDKANAEKLGVDPGGDIMIHGMKEGLPPGLMPVWHTFFNWTTGCIALRNGQIDQMYKLLGESTPITIYANKKAADEAASQK